MSVAVLILCLRSSPLLVLLQCHTIVSTAALGALPPPHLLTSVSLAPGSQAATPITTTAQNQPIPPGATAAIVPPQSNPALPQLTHPLPTAGLVLSPAAEPFPRKLVDKVKSGQFVEMRELLADNISLLNQLETIQGFPPLQVLGAARPRLREVTSLSTWCYCFLGYAAILTSDPTTRDQLAYTRLMIREALRHGGAGWLDYDRAFRQQAAADPSLRWNTLLPALQASTMLGLAPPGQGATFCTLCREVDHTRAQCALLCLHPPAARPLTTLPTTPRRKSDNVCISWNRGSCIFPGTCVYRHICATCHLPHKARDCSKTPDNSIYRQHRGPPQQPGPQAPPNAQPSNR
jgi:hypothetical protein